MLNETYSVSSWSRNASDRFLGNFRRESSESGRTYFSGKELNVETVKLQDNVKHGVLLYPSELHYGVLETIHKYTLNFTDLG